MYKKASVAIIKISNRDLYLFELLLLGEVLRVKEIYPDFVVPELTGILLISHGGYAGGLAEAAGMVFGEIQNFAALCFDEETDPDDFGESIHRAVNSFPAGCLVLADLFGGTPFNQLMLANPERNFSAVCGVNLNMLLQVLLSREGRSAADLVSIAVDAGREGIVDVDSVLSGK